MTYGLTNRLLRVPHKKTHKRIVLVFALPILGLLALLLVHSRGTVTPVTQHASVGRKIHHLYTVENEELSKTEKNYTIHIWMHGNRMRRRFLKSYGKRERDPYRYCSVSNCVVTTNDSQVWAADAVLFHLHQTKGPEELPEHRRRGQVWIFFTDESPYHTFYASQKYAMSDYNGLFNWSMTYRSDSDIPVPYGRTVPLTAEQAAARVSQPNFAKSKSSLVAVLGSNCGGQNHRWNYVRELQEHLEVDVYGNCGPLRCPGHFNRDCSLIDKYKFYLAFENSNCREYITEKMWWNALRKSVVPIVMGAPKKDYQMLCPPGSFIHVDDFASPSELATYIIALDHNDTAYNEYFRWKRSYDVVNEHGYFGSPSLHLCRICEKLNAKNTLPKIYDDLSSFWNRRTDCPKPKWKPAPKKDS